MTSFLEYLKNIFIKNKERLNIEEIIAEDCMISRANISALFLDNEEMEIKKIIQENNSNLILVCKENLDNVVGVFNVFKNIYSLEKHHLEKHPLEKLSLEKHSLEKHSLEHVPLENLLNLDEAIFIAPNTEIKTIVEDVMNQKSLFVILDEFGNTKGIVNHRSIMNYFSYLSSNLDPNTSSVIVKGDVTVDFLEKIFNVNFENFDAKTINGFVWEFLQRSPQQDEIFSFKNLEFKILDIKDRQINKVCITKKTQ